MKLMIKSVMAAAIITCGLSISALTPDIYCSFDKGLDSDGGMDESLSNAETLDSGRKSIPGILNPKSGTEDQNVLRPQGLSGRALMIGRSEDQEQHYSVRYTPEQGISGQTGTLTFWLKPLDWSGADTNGRMFVSAESAGQQLFIYKYYNSTQLYFYYRVDKAITIARTCIADWKESDWHFVGCTWGNGEMKLYVDGQLKNATVMNGVAEQNFKTFNIGTIGWPNKLGKSLIDEVKYFASAISAEGIEREYYRAAENLIRIHGPVNITVGRKTPVVDGKITPFEYAFGGTGFFDARTQTFSRQGRYFLSYDDEFIYVGVITPAGGELLAEKSERDANLWEDDSVEIHFIPHSDGNDKYQFIFNSKGVVYDSKNGDRSWNAAGMQLASKVIGADWVLEVAFPWQCIGAQTAQPLKINICRSYQDISLNTSISPVLRAYMDPPNLTSLTFSPDVPSLDLVSIGNLSSREVEFKIDVLSAKDGEGTVRLNTTNPVLPFQFEKQFQLKSGNKQTITTKHSGLPANSTLEINCRSADQVIYSASFAYSDLQPVSIAYFYTIPDKRELYFVCNIREHGSRAKLLIEMIDESGSIAMKKQQPINTSRITDTVSFSIGELRPADYTLRVTCLDQQGKVIYKNTEEYRVHPDKPAWSGIQAGISDKVPAPWTPLQVSDNSLQCWGRAYRFGGKGLLESVISQNSELLAGDVTLQINGHDIRFNSSLVEVGDAVAKFALSNEMDAANIVFEVTAEFDGLLWCSLNIVPKAGRELKIDRMTLDLPLNRKYLTSFDDNRGIMSKVCLNSETRSTLFNDLSTMPCFWIGNDRIGLMGGMTNLRGWHIKDKEKSMRVTLAQEVITARFNFVDTPVKINQPRKIEFYLQATPVKPKHKLSHTFRESENVKVWTPFRKKYFEYLDQSTFDLEHLAGIKRERESRGWKNFYYVAPHGVSPYSPDWNYFGWLWHSAPPALGNYAADRDISTRERRNAVSFTYACLDCESFFDYKLAGVADLIANPDFGVENLYYDLVWPRVCNNEAHGCGWVDEFGVRQGSFDVRGTREFNKRTYMLLKEKNPDAIFCYHIIRTRTPADSFCDLLVQGESYDRAVAEKESYYDVLTPELVRIAYNTRSSEQEIWLIPQFHRSMQLFNPKRAAEWATEQPALDHALRHFLGYMTVHNIGFMNGGGSRQEGSRLYKILDQLPWDEKVVFHPYWHPGPLKKLTPETDRIMVSGFSREGKALIALLNDTDREELIKVEVDTRCLFGRDGEFSGKDGFSKNDGTFLINNGVLEAKVPPRGFRFIFFD